jgi:orotidine-5'-phosphate decarboxylase
VDQLLIALDVETGAKALALADSLRGIAGGFKIGSRLFTSEGPSIVRTLVERGDRIFLDLKFHDIPNTVATAVAAAASLGVWMINVHASGGTRMMQAARDAGRDTAARSGADPPLVIAVTVLTSLSAPALAETGVERPVIDQVIRLASLAQAAGLDGVVASPQEIAAIRQRCGPDFAIVTPGIRGGSAMGSRGTAAGPAAAKDDQERTLSAAEAVAEGASYIVVGRPVIAAADPRLAAEEIARQMRLGIRS